ncbi:hypothetical protein [Chryseobacterium sp. Mn2064]|uniref:hypothetical protein n=1 Tax=Chryseobacterium sp. Mn2064 TaxID=3395263 RepID=UPI003BC1639F
MKTLLSIIFITVLHIFVSGQNKNIISCKITYLPTIQYEDTSTEISKEQAKKIDSLIHLKSYTIDLNDNDLKMIKELYEHKISESTFLKLRKEKEIIIDFNSIKLVSEKSITDLLSSVIDGSPFTLTANTKNSHLIYNDNFSGMPRLKELQKYLIFYAIYNELPFCRNDNELVKAYFERKNLIKNIMYFIMRQESSIQLK